MITWNWSDTDYKNEWAIFTRLISLTGPLTEIARPAERSDRSDVGRTKNFAIPGQGLTYLKLSWDQ